MKTVYLIGGVLCYAAGIVMVSLFPETREVYPWVFSCAGILLSIVGLCFYFIPRIHRRALLLLPACGIILFGIAHTNHTLLKLLDTGVPETISSEAVITGTIRGPIDERQNNSSFVLEAKTLSDTKNSINSLTIHTRIRIKTERGLDYESGDEIAVTGKLTKPDSFITDTGRLFNYPMYLMKDGIIYQMNNAEIHLIERPRFSFLRTLYRFKKRLILRASTYIPYPESGFLSGILYGEKGSLSPEILNTFRTTGLVHVVVLSGANITIIATFMLRIFSRVSRKFAFMGGIIGICIFALMTGLGTTTLRASIMAILAVGTQWFGREYSIARSLAIAGGIMILLNPLTLVYDTSFQLSFLSTLGLVYVAPLIEKFFAWMPERYELRANLIATCATQITVLPLLMYTTGQVSLISFVVNLIVLPLIPYGMLMGFITALLGLLHTVLAWIPGMITYGILTLTLRIPDIAARIPYASVKLPAVSLFIIILWYIGVIALLIFIYRRIKRRLPSEVNTTRPTSQVHTAGM